MMAAKLYQFLGSPFCAKVRKLLGVQGRRVRSGRG